MSGFSFAQGFNPGSGRIDTKALIKSLEFDRRESDVAEHAIGEQGLRFWIGGHGTDSPYVIWFFPSK
jgi:hypothetical protein